MILAPDIMAAQHLIAEADRFLLLAVPFFILAGNLMNRAGVSGTALSYPGDIGTIVIKAMKRHG